MDAGKDTPINKENNLKVHLQINKLYFYVGYKNETISLHPYYKYLSINH